MEGFGMGRAIMRIYRAAPEQNLRRRKNYEKKFPYNPCPCSPDTHPWRQLCPGIKSLLRRARGEQLLRHLGNK